MEVSMQKEEYNENILNKLKKLILGFTFDNNIYQV